jgi:hypothetical protein
MRGPIVYIMSPLAVFTIWAIICIVICCRVWKQNASKISLKVFGRRCVMKLMPAVAHFPSSISLKTLNVSEASSASVIRRNYATCSVGSVEEANLSPWTGPALCCLYKLLDVLSSRRRTIVVEIKY